MGCKTIRVLVGNTSTSSNDPYLMHNLLRRRLLINYLLLWLVLLVLLWRLGLDVHGLRLLLVAVLLGLLHGLTVDHLRRRLVAPVR